MAIYDPRPREDLRDVIIDGRTYYHRPVPRTQVIKTGLFTRKTLVTGYDYVLTLRES